MNTSPPSDPELATITQVHALAHPTRFRVWSALGAGDATISQLSHRLSLNKGSVSHHLSTLVAAGLVTRGRSRTVRGGTELYFQRTTRRIRFPHAAGADTPSDVAMRHVADEIAAARHARVHHRSVRLTPHQARGLAEHLDSVLHSLEPADSQHPLYGVLTAVYPRSATGQVHRS